MATGIWIIPTVVKTMGTAFWGKKPSILFLHLRDEKQKQTKSVAPDYHLGSYNLLYKQWVS